VSGSPPEVALRAANSSNRRRPQRKRQSRPARCGRPSSGIRPRRRGYRDPESHAFIESSFGKLKEREVWLNEYETLDDARRGIGGYVDRYHRRPHSRLGYKTPHEVKQTWEDHQNIAA